MIHLVLIPALLHVYIFVLESLRWGNPSTNRTFSVKPGDVEATRPFAFNQGFYNLFLAVEVLVGWAVVIGLVPIDNGAVVGMTLLVFGLGSIAAAGLVLVLSSPRSWRSALIQAGPAVVGLAAVFFA